MYINIVLLLCFSLFNAVWGSDIVSGICTVSILFLFALDFEQQAWYVDNTQRMLSLLEEFVGRVC